MPGFINAHTHVGMNYFRGLGSDFALMDWLHHYMWPAEKKWLSHEFVYDSSLLAMAELIRSGTTCINDMFYFMPATADAAILAGMRAFLGIHLIDFPTNWTRTTDESIQKGLDFYERYHEQPLITTTIAPHAPYTISDDTFMRTRALAEEYDLLINVHLHETEDEINQSLTTYKKRPIKRLHDLGFLSPRVIAMHACNLNEEDLAILADTKPSIVHCPEGNMKLASGICPVDSLQRLGLNVALGTDSVCSNNDLDMMAEMRAANFLSKITTKNPLSLIAPQTIELATLNGAKALNISHLTGSLSKGKSADFITIDFDAIEALPCYNPLAQVVYSCGRQHVSDVWVAGRQLMKNRTLLTLDEQEIKAKARYWERKIQG
jgi:5-methylthioadenosine/S-adenosylhomocysteine deaminase